MPAEDSGWAGAEARPHIRTPCHPIVRHYPILPSSLYMHSIHVDSRKQRWPFKTVMKVDLNIPYSRRFPAIRALDLFLPDAKRANGAAVFLVHGGGWSGGSRGQWHTVALHLCNLGYACASAGYRLVPRWKFPCQIEDVRLAMGYFKARARQYGFAPDRVAAMGSSAGGHLVAMLATIGPDDRLGQSGELRVRNTRPNAAICYCPVTSLHVGTETKSVLADIATPFLGRKESAAPALYRSASPLDRVTGDEPPFLFIHGDADDVVPLSHSTGMAAALRQRHVKAKTVTLAGVNHGFGYGVLTGAQKQSIRHVERFLRQHVG